MHIVLLNGPSEQVATLMANRLPSLKVIDADSLLLKTVYAECINDKPNQISHNDWLKIFKQQSYRKFALPHVTTYDEYSKWMSDPDKFGSYKNTAENINMQSVAEKAAKVFENYIGSYDDLFREIEEDHYHQAKLIVIKNEFAIKDYRSLVNRYNLDDHQFTIINLNYDSQACHTFHKGRDTYKFNDKDLVKIVDDYIVDGLSITPCCRLGSSDPRLLINRVLDLPSYLGYLYVLNDERAKGFSIDKCKSEQELIDEVYEYFIEDDSSKVYAFNESYIYYVVRAVDKDAKGNFELYIYPRPTREFETRKTGY